jgi:uncharacterized lipoprotein YddW (UPF0748 family)
MRPQIVLDFGYCVRPATVLAAVVLLSCGEHNPVSAPVGPGSPSDDSKTPAVSPADARMMVRTPSAARGFRGGDTLRLDAVLQKKNGKEKDHDQHIVWSSSDTVLATVDSSGLVTAQDTGNVWIVANYKESPGDSVYIDIVPVPVAKVTLAGPDSISLDDTVAVVAAAFDSVDQPLVGRTFSFASSAPEVASVSSEGQVIGLRVGPSDISAAVEGKVGAHSIRVWLQPVASVSVEPGVVSVPQFHKVAFIAIARDRRGKILSDRPTTWSSSEPAIFYITASGDTASARDLGSAVITASVEGKTGTSDVTATNPVEARALWVTRFEYTSASSVDFAKIATIMQKAASANFNVVYFQARSSGDALYFSDIEPCSPRMCGSLGGPRPSQDPLDVALTEAAKYGIEVHAWLNAYTGFISGSTAACGQFINSTPPNWLKAHPEWSVSTKNFTTGVITRQVDNCSTSSEYMYVSPGVPQVRAQLAQVAADVAFRYGPKGLRGIHLDRIRFPSNQVSYDAASQEAFKTVYGSYPTSNAQATWLDFRRGFVNQGVKEVFDAVRAVNPAMVLSAAVFPGYKSRTGWAATWSYTDLFQDPQAWAQGGYLDVEVPMDYPATAASLSWTVKAYCSNTDWTCVLDDHIERIERQSGRQVYIGVGAIKGWVEMQKQIDLAHDRTATGMSVYSFSLVDAIPNGWALLASGPFRYKATVPAMAWKP